jgi:hypothetical protein
MWIKTSLIAFGMANALAAATPAPRLRKVCTSARAAWGLMWAGRVGESAITTEMTTLMSAGTEAAAAGQ